MYRTVAIFIISGIVLYYYIIHERKLEGSSDPPDTATPGSKSQTAAQSDIDIDIGEYVFVEI